MPKPHIVQCLCGPDRHCITALAYDPGFTAAQADFGSCEDITLTEENAAEYLRSLVDGLIERKAIDPWCGICHAGRPRWFFEDSLLEFETLAEAMPYLEQSARDQERAQVFLRSSKS